MKARPETIVALRRSINVTLSDEQQLARRNEEKDKEIAAGRSKIIQVPITAVDFSQDGERIYIGYDDGVIEIQNAATSAPAKKERILVYKGFPVRRVAELPKSGDKIVVESATTRRVHTDINPTAEDLRSLYNGRQSDTGGLSHMGIQKRGGSPFDIVDEAAVNSGDNKVTNLDPVRIASFKESAAWQSAVWSVSQDNTLLAASDGVQLVHFWQIPSGHYLGWLQLLPDGGYVTGSQDGTYTASDNAEPYLSVEVGKRRWPLADVPAFKTKYYRKDGINLLGPAP